MHLRKVVLPSEFILLVSDRLLFFCSHLQGALYMSLASSGSISNSGTKMNKFGHIVSKTSFNHLMSKLI